MRLPDDQELATATIAAAHAAGITIFDTARAYGNERLIARALASPAGLAGPAAARIATKGGMTRAGEAWVTDGRAKAIRADCEASLVALEGLAIDLYLIHAPDPRTPWRTSLRALARLHDERLVRHIGVSNINRPQLDEALALAPITAVQVPLNVYDDRAVRGGVVERCAELGVTVMAHSPLGGPRRAASLARHQGLAKVARGRGATPAEIALAWLLELSPVVVPIPGARRPETARSSAGAAALRLDAEERAALVRPQRARRAARARADADVLLVMGIPGAGKTRLARDYAARGYVRLNRDERGGGLRELAGVLDEALSAGAARVVLDNTYLTRAARSYVIEAARRHGTPPKCLWLDTSLAHAQANMVERVLERFGALPTPEEMRQIGRREPGLLMPTSQMRALRELEPPSVDEGFAGVEVVRFERVNHAGRPRRAVIIAAPALRSREGWEHVPAGSDAPHLIFDWSPGGSADALAPLIARMAARVSGPLAAAVCPHPGGPPSCWCRPPLPGLPLAFAHKHQADPALLIGTTPTHRTLAATVGADFVLI